MNQLVRPAGVSALLVAASFSAAGYASYSRLRPTAQVQASGLGPCTTAVARAPGLADIETSMRPLGGSPFGVAVSPDGRWSFVSLGDKIAVLSDREFNPTLVREIPLPSSGTAFARSAGETLTHDGRYLLVADGAGAVVISVSRAEEGAPNPVLGGLSAPAGRTRFAGVGSAIEVTTSPNDAFAFVSLEYDEQIAVFDLRAALADRFRSSGFVGTITLGRAVVGMAVSPDGRWLYATSELAAGATLGSFRQGAGQLYGTLSVIDLRKAETTPSSAVVATAKAGCSPVRVAVSPDGRVVWVTARQSDALLAFSAAQLRSNPRHALLASIRVGEAPVGVAIIGNGRYIVVANSNRFLVPGATTSLSIVDTRAALAGKPALLGTVPAGLFPRELAVDPNGKTLLVGNFASDQLETINLSNLNRLTQRSR
jgi:DNA-binding beta-propeller fold protein YncE